MRVLDLVAALAISAAAVPAWAKDAPAEKTVVCKDGSTSPGGRGACRGHGGVDKKATKAAAPEKAKKEKRESKAKEAKEEKARPEKAPAASAGAAAGKTVVCKDGTSSSAGRGACRGHGGVDKKATRAGASAAAAPAAPAPEAARPPAPAAPAPAARAERGGEAKAPANARNTDPTGASARCKDGTYSHAQHRTGACSRHGGVAEWLDGAAK